MLKTRAIVAAAVGLLLIIVAVVYFVLPASDLPAFFPGYRAGDTAHHFKHGIGALLLGLSGFTFAWFNSKPAKRR